MSEQRRRGRRVVGGEGLDCAVEVDGVPEDDRCGEQVESGGAVALLLE